MHELSLVSALVEQVTELSIKESFDQVQEIRISIGALSGVAPSCLEFCFSEATQNSVLEGARLILETVPLELICKDCHQSSVPENSSSLFCSWCHSNNVFIAKGHEFKIIDLEVAGDNAEQFAPDLIN